VSPQKHYIPHHVVTPSKATTKVRVVYDASAKAKQTNLGLNECLHRRPVMLPDLCGLLLRFCLPPIAIVGDIEKAFLSVGLHTPDRDVTRFLWLKDASNPNLENNTQVYRFCQIPFGVISSSFLLSATIKHHLQHNCNPTAKLLLRDTYVDNVITGANSLKEAKELYTEAKRLFSTASMNLREWASSSQPFMAFVPVEDRVTELDCQRVLGVNWNAVTDEISVSKPQLQKLPGVCTKRRILQTIASIFDPLGYFAPSILEAKFFMR